jgi:hypothetical protein
MDRWTCGGLEDAATIGSAGRAVNARRGLRLKSADPQGRHGAAIEYRLGQGSLATLGFQERGTSAQVWDELDEPLGFTAGALAAPPVRGIRAPRRAAAVAMGVALALGLFGLARRNAPLGGEPFAVAKVEVLPVPPKPAAPVVSAVPDCAQEAVTPAIESAAQVEAASGVKVTRGSGGEPPRGLIIDVQRALAARLAPARSKP